MIKASLRQPGYLPLYPLTFWYDKPHIARTSYYRTIFKVHIIKNYIEDSFGQDVLNQIKRQSLLIQKKVGIYIYADDESPAMNHVNGSLYLTMVQRKERKI